MPHCQSTFSVINITLPGWIRLKIASRQKFIVCFNSMKVLILIDSAQLIRHPVSLTYALQGTGELCLYPLLFSLIFPAFPLKIQYFL